MPSERITAIINDLLDQLDQAVREGDWGTVRSRAMDVLAFIPDHEDAREFLIASERRLAMPTSPFEGRPEESRSGPDGYDSMQPWISPPPGEESRSDPNEGDTEPTSPARVPREPVPPPTPPVAVSSSIPPAHEYSASMAPLRRSDAEYAASLAPLRRSDVTIGVDFGTTNTRIAYRVGKGQPVSLPIGQGPGSDLWMPSAVAYRREEDGAVSVIAVGELALELVGTMDDSILVIQDIKRVMVASGNYESESLTLFEPSDENFSWWDPDSGEVVLWETRLQPKQVALEIVKEALSRVDKLAGQDSKIEFDSGDIQSMESHSGTWALARLEHRNDFLGVLRDAGLRSNDMNSVHMEPVLGMIRCVANATAKERVLVFDMGGGTFDVAIGRLESYETESETGVITVFAAGGEPFLGGIDIDREFVKHLEERVADEHFFEPVEKFRTQLDARASQRFLIAVRRLKENLSREKVSELTILQLAGGINVSMDVERVEFEESLVRSDVLIKATTHCLRKLKQAVTVEQGGHSGEICKNVNKLEHKDLNTLIDRIVLIGGSTEIPAVQRYLSDLWPDVQVIESGQYQSITGVAEGATMAGTFESRLVDRLPCSVELVENGKTQRIYDAFEPTTQSPLGAAGISSIHYRIPPSDSPENASVQYRYPDDEEGTIIGVDLRRLGDDPWMSVDLVGRFNFGSGDKSASFTFPGPSLMDFQQRIIDRRRALSVKRKAQQRAQVRAFVNRLPYQQPN